MDKPNVNLIARIADYFQARAWLRDYTINHDSSDSTQPGLLDTGGYAGQEIFCSLLNGSITPMDKFTL
jgi:hypothetical protein